MIIEVADEDFQPRFAYKSDVAPRAGEKISFENTSYDVLDVKSVVESTSNSVHRDGECQTMLIKVRERGEQ